MVLLILTPVSLALFDTDYPQSQSNGCLIARSYIIHFTLILKPCVTTNKQKQEMGQEFLNISRLLYSIIIITIR